MLDELNQYTKELCDKYNVEATIIKQGNHVAIFPPEGGMWVINYYLNINNQKIPIGNEYNGIDMKETKSKIKSIILREYNNQFNGRRLEQ